MNLKMNLQCMEQETFVVTGTTVTGTTNNRSINEKDIIAMLSGHPECVVADSGSFPADPSKAKLQYQYSGIDFVVKVSDGTSTADISSSCMSVAVAGAGDYIYTGSQDTITTTNTAKFTMYFESLIHINITGTATTDGLFGYFFGATKENLNLQKLNKGKQTLTDSWNSRLEGYGLAFIHTTPKPAYCTGTAQANGSKKRTP